jgi:glycosyltransferase involved in cell wall biosynthesis
VTTTQDRDRSRPLRVLYVHPFGAYGGATKSLAEMFAALPHGSVQGVALAPPGVAANSLSRAGMKVLPVRGIAQWDTTRYGHYRGLRWLILLRELGHWPGTIRALWRAAGEGPFDLVHANEITALLPAVLAAKRLHAPLVVHVRSLQRGDGGGRVTAWLSGLLCRKAAAVVAIDEAVRRTLPSGLSVDVVHNGMAVPEQLQRAATPPGRFQVAIIGVLHRAKGVYEYVAAARLLRERGIDVRLLVVGENVRALAGLRGWLLRKLDFARDVRAELEAYVAVNGLESMVEFTGFVADIRSVYARIDAVCFPSHLDAPGRPVFEAALFGLPTIVAMRDPTDDVIVPGRTGLCIDAPTPETIADALAALASDREAARRMGDEARRLAGGRFDSRVCASRMLEIYRRLKTGRSAP